MSRFYLFSTAGCHLCEQAEALLQTLAEPIDYHLKEISENDHWLQRYGTSIPVLLHTDSGDELSWPFDQQLLLQFINSHPPVENHDHDS